MKKFVFKTFASQVAVYSAVVFARAEQWSEVSVITLFILVLGAACGVGVMITGLTVAHENGWRDRDQMPLGRRTEEVLNQFVVLFQSRRRLIYVSEIIVSILGIAGLATYMYPAIQVREGRWLILALVAAGGAYAGAAVPGWFLLATAWRNENGERDKESEL